MFLENEYTNEYYKIINASKQNSKMSPFYVEKHHIIPRCIGGNNSSENLVYLRAADHLKCHELLVNMTEGTNHGKMWSALWRMMNKQSKNQQRDYIIPYDLYELARSKHAEAHSKRMTGEGNSFYNKKHTDETRKVMSERKKGKSYEEIFGVEKAKEMRLRRAQESTGRKRDIKIVTCEFCGTSGGFTIMQRWHGDKCRYRDKGIEK